MRPSALFVDLYELTMAQSYVLRGRNGQATFALWVRSLPREWGYLVAADVALALDVIENFRFTADDLERLRATQRFHDDFLDHLTTLRFHGEVRSVAEGCPVFAGEPILEVTAPIAVAQLLETVLINLVQLPTLVATKASRCVAAAAGRPVVDFAMRRAHGRDAADAISRSTYLAGMHGTSNVDSGLRERIPLVGTMAHSYVLSFADEIAAFRAYAESFPRDCVLLVDTHETLGGVRNAIQVGLEMRARGDALSGIRIDSGDFVALSRVSRALLDDAGLNDVKIFVSGGLDEYEIERLLQAGAAIDAFGVGTFLGVPHDAPTLDIIYKLVSYDGRAVHKTSPGKATLPGAKQVWRQVTDGTAESDCIGLRDEERRGRQLLQTCLAGGARRRESPTLQESRQRCASWLAEIPVGTRRLRAPAAYTVTTSRALDALHTDVGTQ